MSFFYNLLTAATQLDPATKTYIENVNGAGGIVQDISYVNSFITLLKDMNQFNNLIKADSASFGLSKNGDYCSELFDIPAPLTHSVVQTEGSSQILIKREGDINYLESDGTDDYLEKTASIKNSNADTLTMVLVFNFLDSENSTSNSYIYSNANSFGFRAYLQVDNPTLSLQTLTVDGAPGSIPYFPSNSLTNSLQKNTWYIVVISGGAIRINNVLYRTAQTATMGSIPAWSVFRGNLSALTKQAFHAGIILKSELNSSEIDRIMRFFNSKILAYTEFESYNTSIFNGIADADIDGMFWLHRHKEGYSGNCVRLRKSSGGEEDFGFVDSSIGASVDIAAINAWSSGSDLYLVTWYDQMENSDFTTASDGVQPRFYTTGGGGSTTLPYIMPNASEMTRSTTLSALGTCRVYAGYEGLDIGTLFRSGIQTESLSQLRIAANTTYQFTKRIGAGTYGKRLSPTIGRQDSINSIVSITRGGNTGNTPSSADLTMTLNAEIATTTVSSVAEYSSAGNITLFKGQAADFAQKTHGICFLKTDQKELEIEQRLIAFYQIDR